MKFYFLLIYLFIFQLSFSQSYEVDFEYGRYDNIINKRTEINANKSLKELLLLARSYSAQNKQTEYLRAIGTIGKLKTKHAQIVFHIELSGYYQQMLFVDSCLYYADLALTLLKENKCTDSTICSDVYRQYANAMRNGGAYHHIVNICNRNITTMKSRCFFLLEFFETALKYATTSHQKADIYRRIGTMYSDAAAAYSTQKKEYIYFGEEALKYLDKAIKLECSPAEKATCYALKGLVLFYIEEHEKANEAYTMALNLAKPSNEVIYPAQFIAITDWYGNNLEKQYQQTKEKHFLYQAAQVYSENLMVWRSQFQSDHFNDGYNNSAINRLIPIHLELFQLSKDSTHLFQAFQFVEQSKYPLFYDPHITLKTIQKQLKENTAYVSYVSVSRPLRNIAFIITKNDFQIVYADEGNVSVSPNKMQLLYDFTDIHSFKIWSLLFYENYYKPADSLLKSKNIKNIIVSNSDLLSMLNLDILVADTTGSNWKDLPYLFLDYQISYALCAGSYFRPNEIKNTRKTLQKGVSVGRYTEEANLRFSNKLMATLVEKYEFHSLPVLENILQNDICLLLSHGNSSYANTMASINLSSEHSLSAKSVEELKLTNELVIFSACNTNASRQYTSNGAIGNFSQAFRKAGSKAVITTSWAIDDKANAFIIERFLHYLFLGENKSYALHQAKKDYWKQCEQDEEYSPLYWAPHILTGTIEPIRMPSKETPSNLNWLWMLMLFPVGFVIWKKLN